MGDETTTGRFPIPEGHPDHLPFVKWLGDHRLPIDLDADTYRRLYAVFKWRDAHPITLIGHPGGGPPAAGR